uniref:Uncharacterized protein n=1 Tax=Eutreptiella gymnastica TaxID=73025 RepID=A0A7S1NN87_9EUGL
MVLSHVPWRCVWPRDHPPCKPPFNIGKDVTQGVGLGFFTTLARAKRTQALDPINCGSPMHPKPSSVSSSALIQQAFIVWVLSVVHDVEALSYQEWAAPLPVPF